MRLHPLALALMRLKGRQTIHGRPLGSLKEAYELLKCWTEQDFGMDAKKWSEWLRRNRTVYHKSSNLRGNNSAFP